MFKLLNLRLTVKLANMSEDTRGSLRQSSKKGIMFYSCVLLLVHVLTITKFYLTPLSIMTKEFVSEQRED